MRNLRALSFVASLCIIFGITFGPTSASATFNVPTLDDMEIDPWQDLQDIQNQEPQPVPELPSLEPSNPVIMGPSLYSLAGAGDWTLKTNNDVLWVVIVQDEGYGGDQYWNETETFAPGEPFLDLDYIAYGGANYVGGIIGVDEGTWVSIETYNQTYANGEFSLVGEVFGAFAIRLGHPSNTVGVGYLYPNSVELIAKTRMSELVSLGIWELSEGSAYIDDVVTLPDTVLSLTYKFYFSAETKEIRPGGVSSRINLSYYFTDGLTLGEYVPEDEDTGLLRGILAWLQSILEAIISLPGKVADAILSGLQGLFVPSEEDILELKDKYDALLQERLGFVYEAFSWVVQSASDVLRMIQDGGEYEFVFPGVSFPMNGETITIVEETPVSLDNELMDVIRPVLGTIVAFVCVLSFMQSSFYMVTAMISGASYFEWLKGQKGGGSS